MAWQSHGCRIAVEISTFATNYRVEGRRWHRTKNGEGSSMKMMLPKGRRGCGGDVGMYVVVLVLLLPGGPCERPVARVAADDDARRESVGAAHVKARENMVKGARLTYEASQAAYDVGAAVFSDLYTWSRRWLEAERAVAEANDGKFVALKDHSKRMTQLFRKVEALHVEDVKGGEAEKFH